MSAFFLSEYNWWNACTSRAVFLKYVSKSSISRVVHAFPIWYTQLKLEVEPYSQQIKNTGKWSPVCPWAAKSNVHAFYHWCAYQSGGCEPCHMSKGPANYFCGMWTLWHILTCRHPWIGYQMATEAIKHAVCRKQQIHIMPLLYLCENAQTWDNLLFSLRSVMITLLRIYCCLSHFFYIHCDTTAVALLMLISFQATNFLLTA